MKISLFNNSAFLISKNDFCTEIATGKFAKELQSLGNEVTFYGQFLSNVENTTDTFRVLENGIAIKGIERKKNKVLNYLILYLKAIPEIYRSDFIYFFYPTAYRFLIFFAIIFRKKYGLYIRGIDDIKKIESHIFYKGAYHVFTVADYFTNYVNEIKGEIVATTIRPMIMFDEHDIVSNPTYNKIPSQLNLLYLGRMTNDKGIIELLHAIKQLVAQDWRPHLVLVGSGEYLDELQDLAKQLEILEYVNFTGPVFEKDEIIKHYLDADVYILPTYHEGFPRTLYEAMIFGTPIVTTFVGGISGIMIHKKNCLQIQPKSVESIVSSLLFVQQNYDEMVTLAKNASITIKEILETRKLSHAESLNNELKKIRK